MGDNPKEGQEGQHRVDRNTTCPTLARSFLRTGGHHRESLFSSPSTLPTDDEVAFHVWEDTTMREIMQQVQQVSKPARLRRARLSIAVVYPGRDRKLSMKRIGMVHSMRTAPSDDTTLYEMGFRRGDFLDLSILA